ncbi:unnamed protein product [Phytophthora lilii]|uniref:Unnamed protein product n=1 Tax=Phytophthora lilii TaxID=2077276 RepID=A0A9W6UAA5_9STRA|nr:unnamed protein product [Phytophthora lilii]
MLGVIDEADVVEVEEKAPPVYVDKEDDRTNEYILSDKENYGQQSVADEVTILPTTPARYATNSSSTEFCQRIVEDYFSAFSSGFQDSGRDISITPSEASQRDFLNHRFALQGGSEADRPTTVEYVKERWRDLSKCFEVLGFQQKGVARTEFNNSNTLCLIDVTATYILRITFYTIRSVFPHLLANLPLLDVLVGKVIMVPSQIFFSVEKSTGRISLLEENMDFAAAFAELVPDHQELDFVVSQSLLARDGVDCRRSEPSYSLDQLQHVQQHKQLPQVSDAVEECQDEPRSTSRSMSIADILG